MAIAKLSPDAQPPIQVSTPDTIEAPAKSIFTALVPESKINSLLKYVEGYPWTVNYYGQILNVNNTVEHFDPSAPNLSQPYYKIIGAIIQVSSPLSSSYSQETAITTVSGSAIMPHGVKPNVGDLFLAQVDNGEDALFHVIAVSRKTHRKDSLYEIEYNLYLYSSADPETIQTLEGRINETYYFNKDSNFFNRDVLIKPSVKEAQDRLLSFMRESIPYYLKTFVQTKTGSLLVPGHDHTLYDPLLTKFISKTVDYSSITEGQYFRPTFSSNDIEQPSIWDCLLNRTLPHQSVVNRTYNFIPSTMLPIRARLGTLSLTGISYILHPTNPLMNHKVGTPKETPGSYVESITTDRNYHQVDELVIKTTNNDEVYDTFVLHDLFENDFYVVSENFYNYLTDKTVYEDLSYVELLIYKFLSGNAIAKEDLAVTIESYKNWSLLHQFYLLPVMWILIKANM